MQFTLVVPLLNNAAMLMAMVVVCMVTTSRFLPYRSKFHESARNREVLNGLFMGLVGIGILLTPVPYTNDTIFDTRTVLISLTALYFGGLPVTICMAIIAFYRLWLGGDAALTGVLTVLFAGLAGLAWRHWRAPHLESIRSVELLLFGIAVHIGVLLSMLTLPGGAGPQVLAELSLSIMIIYPLVTVLVGKLLSFFLFNRSLLEKAEADEKRLRLAMAATSLDMFELNFQTGKLSSITEEENQRKYPGTRLHQSMESLLTDLHPDDSRHMAELFAKVVAGELTAWQGEFRMKTETGNWMWLYAAGQLVGYDSDGQPLTMLGTFGNITARKHTEEDLKVFRELVDNTKDGIEVVDPHTGRFLDVNAAACQELGYSRAELLQMTTFDIDEVIDPAGFADSIEQIRQKGFMSVESIHKRKDGSVYPVEVNMKYVELGQQYLVAVVRNISDRKQTEEALYLAAMVYENSSEAMMVTDETGAIIDVNPQFSTITGYDKQEVIGETPAMLQSGLQTDDFYRDMWRSLRHKGHWAGEIWNRRKDGTVYPQWETINAVFDKNGEVFRFVAQFLDISERKEAEDQMWRQTNIDVVTNLPNRNMIQERIEESIGQSRDEDARFALMFLDLDRFKEVNESFGHVFGDRLLKDVGLRLQKSVRGSDTVGRLGGDEFIIIIADLNDDGKLISIAEQIIQSMEEPFQIEGNSIFITTSIGITMFPCDGQSVDILLKNADQALYKAKWGGRNRYQFFTASMQQQVDERTYLLKELRTALYDNQLQVYYQPIIDMQTGEAVKAEALVRWLHPRDGLINPDQFIPLAEDSGLIAQIGNFVLQQAIRVARQLQVHRPGLRIAVNMSPAQFDNRDDRWLDELRQDPQVGKLLVLEITEGLLMMGGRIVQEKLSSIHLAGVEVAIDDFGTGYSSLAYLKKFNIAYLKIDRLFVSNMEQGNADYALCDAVITMAHRLGIKVIAEGVETVQQQSLLQELQCDFGQGFLFARPITEEELIKLMTQSVAGPQSFLATSKNP